MLSLHDPDLFRMQCPIGGHWQDALDGTTIAVTDPATGLILGPVPAMGTAETRAAVQAAEAALPGWRARTAKERATLLRRWHALLIENQEDLALLMTAEQGKPLSEASGEIAFAASFIEWFAEEARRINGDVIASPSNDRRLLTLRQPVGVCAAITPWNFPAAMITRKAAPALAAGCTMVIRPASQTPYSALAMVALAERAGIPPGVLNVVTGHPEAIGAELTGNPVVRKLSFTGSTAVGARLMAQGAGHIQKLSLELGGNAPFIVFDDADLDAAIEGAMISKYRNGGQTCVCSNRMYVQAGLYDAFVERLASRASKLVLGDGRAPRTQIGPLIDARALEKISELMEDARSQGAHIVCGGTPVVLEGDEQARYFAPTVLTGVKPSMRVAREEIFGPVAPVLRFESEEEVIGQANDTEYGLASYVYTRDMARVWRVAEALEFGMVGVNTGLISTAEAPFGGVKQSGLGREGSKYGIEEYLELKYLCLQVA